jgi:hypothetical protein
VNSNATKIVKLKTNQCHTGIPRKSKFRFKIEKLLQLQVSKPVSNTGNRIANTIKMGVNKKKKDSMQL